MKKPLILVSNSHIDPVWLWEWEEGVAETLSTFRTAVTFCEESSDFVFCHNEALLYEWVEKYDPALFARIKKQVAEGKWQIIGGWYLQPDCNMILGESAVRQIITGKKYFLEKFGKEPQTACNFDSFGHSRGLVQLLTSAGYDSYLFCRPDKNYLNLPGDNFQWIGFDGSAVTGHRAADHYNSSFGKAAEKISGWIDNPENKEKSAGLILWGIGNHGGGPSKKDISDIKELSIKEKVWNIIHGTPDDYFSLINKEPDTLPVYKGDLNPFAVGCYTSMKRLKQPLYKIEHKYYSAEKLLVLSSSGGGHDYPEVKMNEALKEILFCQFHDLLPGTSVETVETDVLNRIGYANHIIDNEISELLIKAGNFLASALPGEFPVMILNPHPFDVDEVTELELQLPEPNSDKTKVRVPFVYDETGRQLEVQTEKPLCNIREDHRKKIVFRAIVKAGSVSRYSCFLKDLPLKEKKNSLPEDLTFLSGSSKIVFDKNTGFPVSWEYKGRDLFSSERMVFAVIEDTADPWGMGVKYFGGEAEYFRLMDNQEAAGFAGLKGSCLNPVYISENGPVRTVIESLFTYNNSRIQTRFFVTEGKPGFDVEITVYWMEKDKILKWIVPVGFNMNCIGRSISGINCCKHRNREFVMRDWLGMKNFEGDSSFSICSDGAYGYDITGNLVRISLLRAPSYSGHPVEGQGEIVMPGRAVKRIDQGVHSFRFRFIPGDTDEIIDRAFNNSDLFNNPPFARIVYPSGIKGPGYSGITISDEAINLQSVKMNVNGEMVIRLLNPCKEARRFRISIPLVHAETELEIEPKKLKTWVINRSGGEFFETNLLERLI